MNAIKKRISSSQQNDSLSPNISNSASSTNRISTSSERENLEGLSRELIPIVTLMSSQSHRRYNEGLFMIYYDLNGDGKPADREWKEVYGILTGNQLAYWDAASLAQFKHNPDALFDLSAKPNYINFTDSVYNAVKSLPAATQNLDNVIIVSTTLKNRYILQFKTVSDLNTWYCALRLSNYEYKSLQEAYTGALLSARGSRLSDIRTILAEKRFDHEEWVSIRYGSGMAWKRCYVVVEPSTSKRKEFIPGRILCYENEQKKKKGLMAVLTNASAVAAVYPQSHLLIDHSTMLKMEGFINFTSPSLSTKVSARSASDFKQTSVFLMPEQHSAVPGFDTLIRFLVPLLDAFGLYGRPKRLKANRNDVDSLLFGLPTLPHVHYFELEDIIKLTSQGDFFSWDMKAWNSNIQALLKSKIDRGYDGCGSQKGYSGAIKSLKSPVLSTTPRKTSANTQLSSSSSSSLRKTSSNSTQPPNNYLPTSPSPRLAGKGLDRNVNNLSVETMNKGASGKSSDRTTTTPRILVDESAADYRRHDSVQLAEIYQKYSDLKYPDLNPPTDASYTTGAVKNLNGDDLSAGISKLDMNKNVYPTNDSGLFSGDDDENYDDDSGEDSVDVRTIGLNSSKNSAKSSGLKVPSYADKSSSHSSVASPMTQFNDFRDQLKTVEGFNNDSLSSLSSGSSSKPTPPPHASPENLDEVQGANTNTATSSKSSLKYPGAVKSPLAIADPTDKPRFISSPNSSQNHINRFPNSSPIPSTSPTKRGGELQYPVSPVRVDESKLASASNSHPHSHSNSDLQYPVSPVRMDESKLASNSHSHSNSDLQYPVPFGQRQASPPRSRQNAPQPGLSQGQNSSRGGHAYPVAVDASKMKRNANGQYGHHSQHGQRPDPRHHHHTAANSNNNLGRHQQPVNVPQTHAAKGVNYQNASRGGGAPPPPQPSQIPLNSGVMYSSRPDPNPAARHQAVPSQQQRLPPHHPNQPSYQTTGGGNLRGYDNPQYLYSYSNVPGQGQNYAPQGQSSLAQSRHPYAQAPDQYRGGGSSSSRQY
ncbi:uncharacterized protein LODBEIA_P05270 [Lodderomyces beijingensis]|uniref:PH domain-containing protein n=1 Tax=Lodderomyces beijingensis TaxID=1775926 RepID=A0ABP0ZFF0_9ASCO